MALLFFQEWINEKDEEYLLEKYAIRPGETRVKLNIADWLLYTAEELTTCQECNKSLCSLHFENHFHIH